MKRLAGLLVISGLLGACAAPGPMAPPDERLTAFEARNAMLAEWETWRFTGRLGVDAGPEGGSGRLDWSQAPDLQTLRFRGALGQGAWRLSVTPTGATLELGDGTSRQDRDVDRLVQRETGWRLPLGSLAWWVRGAPDPDAPPPRVLELDDDGALAALVQGGWRIEFRRHDTVEGWRLPTRLEASRDEVTVKLAISRWAVPATDVAEAEGDD